MIQEKFMKNEHAPNDTGEISEKRGLKSSGKVDKSKISARNIEIYVKKIRQRDDRFRSPRRDLALF